MTTSHAPARDDVSHVYTGHLVSLRRAQHDDAPTLFAWRNDLEAFHLLHLPDGVATLQDYAEHWEATVRHTVTLIALGEPDGDPVGVVQAYDVNSADGWCFVLSYMSPAHRNQRAGLEATVGFWDYLLTEMNMRKIYMDIVESNLGWLRGVPGIEVGLLREEGRFRRHATYDGVAQDVVRLALYRDAWLAIRDYVLPLFRLGVELPAAAGRRTRERPGRSIDQDEQTLTGNRGPRVDLVKRYLRHAREGALDGIVAMVAEDVVFTTPLTGAVVGKDNLANLLRFRHRMLSRAAQAGGPLPTISWRPPEDQDDWVMIHGTAPTGRVDLAWRFDESNKMIEISIDAPPELMTAYLLSGGLPVE